MQLHESRAVDELGRVVIPPVVRVLLGIEAGDRVAFVVEEGEVYIRKENTPEG